MTAFTIESSKRLEIDHQQTTATILLVIHKQLDSFARQNVTTLPPLMMDPASTFHPPTYAVVVNMLWYLSLLLSLATVLIGILCLQWLREHRRDPNSGPEDVFAIRALRIQSLNQWHVPAIVGALPMLLLGALSLFFAGLGVLLWSLNNTVAIAASTAIGAIVFLFLLTTALPALFARCAFRSPQAWLLYYAWSSLSMHTGRLRMELSKLQDVRGKRAETSISMDSPESKQHLADWFSVDEDTIKAKAENGFDWFTTNFNRDQDAMLMFVQGVEAKVRSGQFRYKEDENLFKQMYYLALREDNATNLKHRSAYFSELPRNLFTDAALALCMDHAVQAHPSLQPNFFKRRLELQLNILMYFSEEQLPSSLPKAGREDRRVFVDAMMPALLRSTEGISTLCLQVALGEGPYLSVRPTKSTDAISS